MATTTFLSHPRRSALAAAGLIAGAIATLGVVPAASASTAPTGDAYCAAHVAAETAFATGDPAVIGPAAEALEAAAPPELADAVAAALANAEAGPLSPEFAEAYGQLIDYVKASCGFTVLEVLGTDYAFGGLPEEVPAGPTVFTLTNEGEEVHEIVLVRRNDGDTTPVEELLALPDEEVFGMITFVNQTFAMPGEASSFVADLPAGDYIAVCFLPVGSTPDVFAEMMMVPDGSAPPGSPPVATEPAATEPVGTDHAMGTAPTGSEPSFHAMEGMVAEFTVTDGAAAPATTGA